MTILKAASKNEVRESVCSIISNLFYFVSTNMNHEMNSLYLT
jgi:hypothetical protein